MKKEEAELIIETLETAIDWAEYATPYFQEKHNLTKDKEDVQKAIELLRAATLENKICENCKFYDTEYGVPFCKNEELIKKLPQINDSAELFLIFDTFGCNKWEQK